MIKKRIILSINQKLKLSSKIWHKKARFTLAFPIEKGKISLGLGNNVIFICSLSDNPEISSKLSSANPWAWVTVAGRANIEGDKLKLNECGIRWSAMSDFLFAWSITAQPQHPKQGQWLTSPTAEVLPSGEIKLKCWCHFSSRWCVKLSEPRVTT